MDRGHLSQINKQINFFYHIFKVTFKPNASQLPTGQESSAVRAPGEACHPCHRATRSSGP